MKKIVLPAVLSAAVISISLSACGETDNPDKSGADSEYTVVAPSETSSSVSDESETIAADPDSSDETSSTEEARAAVDISVGETTADAIPDVDDFDDDTAFDEWEEVEYFDSSSMNFSVYNVKESGTYSFVKEGTDDAAYWMIFILDEEFSDGARYLFSNYEPDAKGDAELELESGQYVYCLCSVNEWTAVEPTDCNLKISRLIDYEEVSDEAGEYDENTASEVTG